MQDISNYKESEKNLIEIPINNKIIEETSSSKIELITPHGLELIKKKIYPLKGFIQFKVCKLILIFN